METAEGPIILPAMVVAEAGYLIDRELGPSAEAALYRSIADGEVSVEPVGEDDWGRIAELVEQYADLGLGGVDASVVALAERLGERRVATLDRRDFSVVKPLHAESFEIVP